MEIMQRCFGSFEAPFMVHVMQMMTDDVNGDIVAANPMILPHQ